MRRRALCAASASGGEAPPTFDFPAYIYADYCEKDGVLQTDCVSESLGENYYLSLYKYLEYILKKYGTKQESGAYTEYNIIDISVYGVHIYVEADKSKMSRVDDISLYDNGYFTSIDATHELGGTLNNYVTFSEEFISWGYGV